MNDYVVYCHLDHDGVVRYIGSGKMRRVREKGCRNRGWNEIFRDKPLVSVVLREGLTIDQARKIEMEYMSAFKDWIVNVVLNTSLVKRIPQQILDLVHYCPTSPSGLVYSRSNKGTGKNKREAGDIAGYKVNSRGKMYWRIKFKQDSFPVHRIVFYIHHPDFDQTLIVDHRDSNGLNNTIENLRSVSFRGNCEGRENLSGESGVVLYKRGGELIGYYVQVDDSTRKYFTAHQYKTLDAAFLAAKIFKNSNTE